MTPLFDPASDRQKDKPALLAEVELMRRVFGSVANGVSISDATVDDLPLVYVNPAFERMTGYTSDEMLGRNCRFLQQGETPPRELEALRRAIRDRQDVRVVLKNYTKQGSEFWNELYLSPVFDSSGQLVHYVGIQNDITDRVELRRRIEHMALHDGLTGLANRSLALDRLQEGLDRARRHGGMIAVLFIDLDGFKAINDGHGHETGDQLLQAVAARLRLCVRGSDCAARMGGDEFVVIAPDLSAETEADEVRQRVMLRIEEPLVLKLARVAPRASIGVSVFPRDGATPQALLKAADLSMYLAKQTRRDASVATADRDASTI